MRVGIFLFVILPATGCLGPSLASFENSFVYQPVKIDSSTEVRSSAPWQQIPMGFEEVKIPYWTVDWSSYANKQYYSGLFAEAKNPRAVVLYCHGNSGNVLDCEQMMRVFRDKLNVSVLAFDYSGYGRSDGTPSEAGLYADARAARAWLAERAKIPEKDIVLCGYSLGGGVAVELAAKDGARGLILDRTFTSIPDVGESFVPVLPIQWLMVNRYDSLSKIKNYHGPLLQFHGDKDSVVPYELGQKLFAAANEPKQFVRIPGGDHLDPWAGWQINALNEFFDQLNGQQSEKPRQP